MSLAQRLPHTAAAIRRVRDSWTELHTRWPVLGGCLVMVAYVVGAWGLITLVYLIKEAFR